MNANLCICMTIKNKIKMKTFRGVFTKTKLFDAEIVNMKQYTFSIDGEVNIDDLIYSDEYKKYIQVVFIYEYPYKYVNIKTCEVAQIIVSVEDKHIPLDFPFVPIKFITKNENRTDNTPETQGTRSSVESSGIT